MEHQKTKEEKKPPEKPTEDEKQNFDSRGDKKGLKTLTSAEIAIILLLVILCSLVALSFYPSIFISFGG